MIEDTDLKFSRFEYLLNSKMTVKREDFTMHPMQHP